MAEPWNLAHSLALNSGSQLLVGRVNIQCILHCPWGDIAGTQISSTVIETERKGQAIG